MTNRISPNAIMLKHDGKLFAVKGQEFNPLKQYSEEEFSLLIQTNPSFLANDAKLFRDQSYVKNMALLYSSITFQSLEKVTSIKKFFIGDLERALQKLSKNHPDEYDIICREFAIDPKKHKSNNNWVNISTITPGPIIRLSSWGYIQFFSPHIVDVIPKIARKFWSASEMSELQKAKIAHLFFVFIASFNRMPYDQERFVAALQTKTCRSTAEKNSLYSAVVADVQKIEAKAIFEAIMLENAYNAFFKNYEDSSFDADAIMYFLTNIVDKKIQYQILEFADMLTVYQKEEFQNFGLIPINFNNQIRCIKEKLFSFGSWATDIEVFMRKPQDYNLKAMKIAYKKYADNGFIFGQGVEAYKKNIIETMYASENQAVRLPGYLYANKPAIRISDENELKMFAFKLSQKPNN